MDVYSVHSRAQTIEHRPDYGSQSATRIPVSIILSAHAGTNTTIGYHKKEILCTSCNVRILEAALIRYRPCHRSLLVSPQLYFPNIPLIDTSKDLPLSCRQKQLNATSFKNALCLENRFQTPPSVSPPPSRRTAATWRCISAFPFLHHSNFKQIILPRYMSSPFCRLPPELTSYILVLAHLHAPFFLPSNPSCRCPERTHQVPRPTFPALYILLTISRSIRAVAFSTPQLFTSLEVNLSVFPNPCPASNLYRYDGDLSTMAPKINSFFSRSGRSLPLTLRLRAMDWEEWYEYTTGHPYTNRAVYLQSSSDSNDQVLVPLAFIYNSNPFGIPPEIPFSVESMLSLRRQYFNTLTHQVQHFISDVILNPSLQGRWEFLQLEVPVHFGFKDLLSSLVASGAGTTPAWKALRTLRLTASYEDSSLAPAEGTGSLLFGGKSIQAPNLKDLRLDLRTAVKSPSISTNLSREPFSFDSIPSINPTPLSSTITNLRLDTYTTTPHLISLLSSVSGLEMCDVRLHADVMDEEEMDTGFGAAPPLVGQIPLPTPSSAWATVMKPRGRTLLPRLTYLAIRSAYHLNILNHLCAPALKGLYVEMDNDGEELDATLWEEDYGHGVGGGIVDEDDSSASIQFPIPTTNEQSTPAEILEAFVHACSATSSSLELRTGIKYLKLVSVPMCDSSLIHILRLTPQLRELRVWWGPAGRFIDELLPASVLREASGVVPIVNVSDMLPLPLICVGQLRYVERHPNYPHQPYPRSRLQRATTFVPHLEYLYVNILPRRREQVAHLKERLERLADTRKAAYIEYVRHATESGAFVRDQATSASQPEKIGPLNFVMIRSNERDCQHLGLERMDTEMPEFECST